MRNVATIAETIRQKAPFDSTGVELLMTLVRASDLARDRAAAPLRAADLSMPQYNVLRILRGSPAGLQTHEVLERLVSRAPNLTRLVDKLETKGLIRRIRSRVDRRVVTLRITPAGLDLLTLLDEPVRRAVLDSVRGLGEADQRRLCDLLNRLRDPLEPGHEAGNGVASSAPSRPTPSAVSRTRLANPRSARATRRTRQGESLT